MNKNFKLLVLSSTLLLAVGCVGVYQLNNKSLVLNAEATLGDLVGNDVVSVTKDSDGNQVLNYSECPGWNVVSIAVTGFDYSTPYFEMNVNFSEETAIGVSFGDNNLNWGIGASGHVTYASGDQLLQFDLKSGYQEVAANFTIYLYTDANATEVGSKTITVKDYGFKASLTKLDTPYSVSDITGTDIISVNKNADGEQVLSYSECPGWATILIDVTGYDAAKPVFEFVCTPSDTVTLCFAINGNIDWGLGHASYGAKENIIKLDTSTGTYGELPTNFQIGIYVDASATVDATKTITVKSYDFKAVEINNDFTIESGRGIAMTAVENTKNGWDLSWTNDNVSYRRVEFNVKNQTTEDMIVLKMSTLEGRCMGITLILDDNSTVDIRNHWSTDTKQSVFQATTDNTTFVYNLNAYPELKEHKVECIAVYFDPPTNTYVPNLTDEAHVTIHSIEMLKSAEFAFEEVTVNAVSQSSVYDGNAHVFSFTSNKEVDFAVYYKEQGNDSASWNSNAPKNAGTYSIKLQYAGSLENNYFYDDSSYTLTIDKAHLTASSDLVTFDPETGDFEYNANEVIVATSSDFNANSILEDEGTLKASTTVYVKYIETVNHYESEVVTVELKLNSDVNEETSDPVTSEPEVSAPEASEPEASVPTVSESISTDTQTSESTSSDTDKKEETKKGCKGMATGDFTASLLALGGLLISRRKKQK